MKCTIKSLLLLLITVLFAGIQQISAQTLKEFFNSSEVPLTYLGIDYTHTKVFNENQPSLTWRDKHFPEMNLVTQNDTVKFDFRKAFTKSTVIYDLKTANERNSKIDAEKVVSSDVNGEVKLTPADFDKIAIAYKSGKKGVGLLFIVESMDKRKVQEVLNVVLLDLATGKILVKERYTEKPAGFGVRSYWVRPVRNVLEDIKKSKYKEWRAAN